MKKLGLILVLSACFGAASVSSAQVYDAYAGFSASQNPTGLWTYGWSTALAGPIVVYTDTFVKLGGYNWSDPNIEAEGDPNVAYVPIGDTEADVPPGTLAFHPGPGNQFSHCCFTAPAAGTYNIQASFAALSSGGPHIYILHNGVTIGDSLLVQGTPWTPSFTSVALAAGDTVDAVVGIGSDGFFSNDETMFSLTITNSNGSTQGGPFVPGTYAGLLTGTSGPGGVGGSFLLHVRKSGGFTGSLHFEGKRAPMKGIFTGSNSFSTVVQLKNGTQLYVSLGFDADGNLSGSVVEDGETFSLSGGPASNTAAAQGIYPFAISPPTGQGTLPVGTGIGSMHVSAGGVVSIVGRLGDGTSFSTSSIVTSGSSVPVYADSYGSPLGGIAGTLVFQDVPNVSDCAGTLYWNRPAKSSSSPYAQGFQGSSQFLADQFDPSIHGLNHDDVSFLATGADLTADFSANITLHSQFGPLPLFSGNAPHVTLSVIPVADVFFGTFEDSATHRMRSFTGVLLPKSRTGAGLFFSAGLGGSVDRTTRKL